MPLKPTPLQTWVKEDCGAVDWRSVGTVVVVVKLLPGRVEVVTEVLLKSKEVEPLVDLALSEALSRRRNISLRCHGRGYGCYGGSTDRWSLASPAVG